MQTPITERLLALKSAPAVKIGLMLYQKDGVSFATTPRILCKTVHCGYRALLSALDELTASGLIFLERAGISLLLRQNPAAEMDPTVYESNTPVYEEHNCPSQKAVSTLEPSGGTVDNSIITKTVPEIPAAETDIAQKAADIAPGAKSIAPQADCTEEDDNNISSSSSKTSAEMSTENVKKVMTEIFSSLARLNVKRPVTLEQYEKIVTICDEGRKKLDQLCPPPQNFTQKVQALLNEIDMGSYWALKQVLEAGVGLPEEEILNIVGKCIMHAARTPAYIVKALTFRKIELAEVSKRQTSDDKRHRYEIRLGEKLLAGEKVKFEQLAQSKLWEDLAHALFIPAGQYCVLKEEYRAEVQSRIV